MMLAGKKDAVSKKRLDEVELRIRREHSVENLHGDSSAWPSSAIDSIPASPEETVALQDAFSTWLNAICTHFPGNLFWDFKFPAHAVHRAASLSADPIRYIGTWSEKIAALHAQFGGSTKIRFRYAHDFLYGFDWAKWVRKNPSERHGIKPFDIEFIDAMAERGHELFALIDSNDDKYHQLETEHFRNPFPFSREPAEEIRLHRELAELDLIPIPAWKSEFECDLSIDFSEKRRELALG